MILWECICGETLEAPSSAVRTYVSCPNCGMQHMVPEPAEGRETIDARVTQLPRDITVHVRFDLTKQQWRRLDGSIATGVFFALLGFVLLCICPCFGLWALGSIAGTTP